MVRTVVSLKLNQKSIRAKIDQALSRSSTVKRLAYKKAYGIFYGAKRAMLAEFDRHLITQELKTGETATNISDTLGGYGNLFSFIGFHQGADPTEDLRRLLEMATQFHQTMYRKGAWYFRVELPTREAIEGATQMPWEGGSSWAFAVEKYISGLSHYMYKKWDGANSRSGMGLQLPYENWEDLQFKGRPYISEILNAFRERVNKNRD